MWAISAPVWAAPRPRRSPLLEAGITKDEVRQIARSLGALTWDKPAMACLSSRVPGTPITPELLRQIEAAEDTLASTWASTSSACHHNEIARIERPMEIPRAGMP